MSWWLTRRWLMRRWTDELMADEKVPEGLSVDENVSDADEKLAG